MVKVKINETSTLLKLNKEDGFKILKGAGIAMGGVLITYALEVIPNVDFGIYTAAVVGISGIVLNSLRKLLAGK